MSGNKNVAQKNGAIEFYRFLFSMIIGLLHFRGYGKLPKNTAFNGGYLGVEFFFIVSGYFLMKQYEKESNETNVRGGVHRFFIKRYFKYYPEYLFAFIITALLRIELGDFTVKQVMVKGFWEFFMLQAGGMGYTVTIVFWFVSALLFASTIVYFLLVKFKDDYVNFIAPLVCFMVLAYYKQNVGYLDVTSSMNFLFFDGVWRGVAELGLGCIVYKITQNLKERLNGRMKGWRSFLELMLLVFIVMIMWRTRRDEKDFIMVVVIAFFVMLVMLGDSYLSQALNNKVSLFLGNISYGIYLNQYFMICLLKQFPGYPYWYMAALMLSGTIVLSIFSTWFCRKVTECWLKKMKIF